MGQKLCINANKLHKIRERLEQVERLVIAQKERAQMLDNFVSFVPTEGPAGIADDEEYARMLAYHVNLTTYLSQRYKRYNHGDPMEIKYHMGPAQVKTCGIPEELERVHAALRAYEILTGTDRDRVIWGL